MSYPKPLDLQEAIHNLNSLHDSMAKRVDMLHNKLLEPEEELRVLAARRKQLGGKLGVADMARLRQLLVRRKMYLKRIEQTSATCLKMEELSHSMSDAMAMNETLQSMKDANIALGKEGPLLSQYDKIILDIQDGQDKTADFSSAMNDMSFSTTTTDEELLAELDLLAMDVSPQELAPIRSEPLPRATAVIHVQPEPQVMEASLL